MDFFSHLLLGFVLGQALQLDGSVQVILIVSSVILDIDAISIRGCEASFGFHRGPLHSILSAILFSLLIGTVYIFFTRLSATIFISVVSICLGGLLIHIFLDLLTSGGIKVLWPFSTEKFTLNLTHFVDPIIFVVLLITSILIAFVNFNVNVIRS
jgi:inner membrane protein